MKTLTGIYDQNQSGEKASIYELSNGVRATVVFSHYGEMISNLKDSKGNHWNCSNGINTLPEAFNFARDWLEKYLPQIEDKIMRPRFQRVYPLSSV